MKYSFTALFLLIATIYSYLTLQTIASNMPYNPLRSGKMNADIVTVFPEAWAFFTRSPREEQIHLYKMENCQLVEEDYQNTSSKAFFGFSKKHRAKGVELGHLYEKALMHKDDWIACDGDINACADWDCLPSLKILNPTYSNQICGEYYIVTKKIIPWAWSASKEKIHMPSTIIKINALCSTSTITSRKGSNP